MFPAMPLNAGSTTTLCDCDMLSFDRRGSQWWLWEKNGCESWVTQCSTDCCLLLILSASFEDLMCHQSSDHAAYTSDTPTIQVLTKCPRRVNSGYFPLVSVVLSPDIKRMHKCDTVLCLTLILYGKIGNLLHTLAAKFPFFSQQSFSFWLLKLSFLF